MDIKKEKYYTNLFTDKRKNTDETTTTDYIAETKPVPLLINNNNDFEKFPFVVVFQ
jgi:hypothetical protein